MPCIDDCSLALAIDSNYVKVYMRRGQAYEATHEFEKAKQDYEKVLSLEKDHIKAKERMAIVSKRIEEEMEIKKAEMLAQMKTMGNNLLGKFGMSLDQFQSTKDEKTGAYNISFKS